MKAYRLFALLQKDWQDFWAGRSWIVVLILPLFIMFVYSVIYRQAERQSFSAGYWEPLNAGLKQVFENSRLRLVRFRNENEARQALSSGQVAAVLSTGAVPGEFSLLVNEERSLEMTAVVHALNLALIKVYSGENIPRVTLSFTNPPVPLRWLSYPGWMIQIILTICLLQAATAIADEKEKSLGSLLVSPVTWGEYLSSRLIWNLLLCTSALLLTTLLTGAPVNIPLFLMFGCLGSLVYTFGSLLIGLRSPGPLFARTLATLAYIISALPVMVRNLDFTAKAGLKAFPSYLILLGMEQALDPSPGKDTWLYGLILFVEAAALFVVSYAVIKKADY